MITEFLNSVSISSSYNRVFILSPTGIKTYQTTKSVEVVTVSKVAEVMLSDTMKTAIAANTAIQSVITIKCQCSLNAPPKLICFAATLSCIAISQRGFADCTVAA